MLRRFREAVTETAGFYNTAGFVDDTRAFCSIPVRHDVARRIDAGFLARLVAEHRLAEDEAAETIVDLAYHLPKRVFRMEGPMTQITAVDVHDVRFPTAAAGDGSDAINRGDYSATYVELRTDEGPTGAGLTFTNGRGNEITCAAVRALAHHVRRPDGRGDLRRAGRVLALADAPIPQLRWLGPEKGVIHMAAGALVNAVWDLRAKLAGMPMWRLLAPRCPPTSWSRASTSTTSPTRSPRTRPRAILDKGRDGLEERLARSTA